MHGIFPTREKKKINPRVPGVIIHNYKHIPFPTYRLNSSFSTLCSDRGIEHQFSSPRVPQQNGVVERKNRTLVEMARTMLDEHSTPRRFWAEAIFTACYISNRVFLRSVIGKTSFELRFGHKPKVSHFKIFGCKCFILKHGNLDKFESRCSDGIFLGYPAHSRGYRVQIGRASCRERV